MDRWLPQRPLRWRPLWLVIGWALVAAVVWLSLTPRLAEFDVPFVFLDKAGHFTAYFVLMFWYASLYQRPAHWLLAVGFVLLGVALEGAQYLTGYRGFEFGDIVADAVGIAVALLLARTPLVDFLQFIERRVA